MNNIDKFLQFLFERINDDTISVTKKMKYGYRYYYLYLHLEGEEVDSFALNITSNMSITIDNRNNCIEINSIEDIVIESEELVKKWSDIFERYLNDSLEEKVQISIDTVLSNSKDKSLLRDYQMEKIFKKDDKLQ